LRGKAWSIDEERLLRRLVQEGKGTQEISQIMGKTRVSVKAKLSNLCLSVVVATGQKCGVATATASSPTPTVESTPATGVESSPVAAAVVGDIAVLKSNEPLPSIEEKLRTLDAASRALEQPGLRPTEISRLRNIIESVRVYEQLFAKYVNYCALEAEVVELRRQLASEKNQK
jgi:hypothetical protein